MTYYSLRLMAMKSSQTFTVFSVALLMVACQSESTGPLALGRASSPSSIVVAGSGTWTIDSSAPTLTGGSAGAAVNGYLYVTGGADLGDVRRGIVQRFDPSSGDWQTMASMPDSLKFHVAVSVRGNLFVASGITNSQYCNAHLWRYRPSTNTWAVRAPAPHCHNFTAAAAVDGYLYLIGGSDGSDQGINYVDRYDPATNTWTTVAPLPATLNSHEAVVVNGRIYVIGGWDMINLVNNTRAYEYDPATDTWTPKASWTEVYDGGMNHSASGVVGGIAYIMFGAGSNGSVLAYDPAHDEWTAVASHPRGDWWFRASGVIDGQMHFVGGMGAGFEHDVFTPAYAGNHRPVVAGLAPADLLEGESYVATSSFTDLDEGPWTATVEYDTTIGFAPLPLTDMTFALNHQYTTRGRYYVRVRVQDDGGLVGSRAAYVRVRPVSWGLQEKMFADVDTLVLRGLGGADAERLYHWLRRARAGLRNANGTYFDARLDDFKAEVDELVIELKITELAGDGLKAYADRLKAAYPD